MALSKIQNNSFEDAAVHGRRNLLHNGAMNVAQRGTSDSSSGAYLIDRFRVFSQASFNELAFTQSQSSTVPSGEGFNNSLKIEVTTAETALSAGDLFYVRQVIEAQNLQSLKYGTSSAEKLTLSFWVRSSLTGKYSVLFYSEDATRSNTQSFNVNTADTWEYKTITIDGDTSGQFDDNRFYGLGLHITLAAGSTYAGTPHTGWGAYASSDFAFSDNVDFSAQTGTFFITGMQLEVGDKATPFEHRSFGEELALCQRYFQKSYDYGTAPGTGTNAGAYQFLRNGTLTREPNVRYAVEMRANPTETFYASDSGTSGKVRNRSTNADVTAVIGDSGTNGFNISMTVTSGQHYGFQYTADAEF
jgi:hypothetical protein